MKTFLGALALAIALQLSCFLAQSAEAAKTYQVTGPILELTDKAIVIQKGDERWEIARDDKTKVDGELKVGSKVTVHYRMYATSVETRAGKSEGKKKSK